jgi:regulator-associated protein of mTOR
MTMTAVAVQQNGGHRQQYNPRQSPHSSNGPSPHQSRPQSYTSPSTAQIQRQAPPLQNGTSAVMNPRPAVSNDPVPALNGNGPSPSDSDRRSSASAGRSANTSIAHDRRLSLQDRPTSAPGANGESSQDESERERPARRRPKLLLRSKSDFGPRGEDPESQTDDEIQDWGARHGFEDHYASEEYVSQLANVSRTFLRSVKFIIYIGRYSSMPKSSSPLHCHQHF